MAAAITLEEIIVYADMMRERGSGKRFDSVSVYISNTLALHIAGTQIYSSQVKHVAVRYLIIKGLPEKGRTNICQVKTEDQLAAIGTKHLGRGRQRFLVNKSMRFEPDRSITLRLLLAPLFQLSDVDRKLCRDG